MTELNRKILIKGKAGMGNRILSLLDAIVYAKITHRQLVVDWSDYTYSHDGSNAFSRFFELADAVMLEEVKESVKNCTVVPSIWQGNLSCSVNHVIDTNEPQGTRHRDVSMEKYTIDIANIGYEADLAVRWAFNGELHKLRKNTSAAFPNLQKLADDRFLHEIYKRNIFLNKAVENRIRTFKEKTFPIGPVIGVHVRYTDRKTTVDKYPKIIRGILQKDPDAKIFLATDNQTIESNYRQEYGAENIITTDKWYPEGAEHLHQNADCPDRVENGIEALMDMYLLGACSYLICDQNSTFAVVSRIISDIEPGNFFDVSKYSAKNLAKSLFKVIRR